MFELKPGDIFATKGTGIAGWFSRNLMLPKTDRFHYGIIWKYLDNDFLILESLGTKGLSIGKLSWRQDEDLKYYRVKCPEDLRFAAPDGLIDWGRSKYDYWLIVKVTFGAIVAWIKILFTEWKVRRLRAEDLPFAHNDSLICSEAVDVAYATVGVNIIPLGVIPLPSAFKQAEIDDRIYEIQVK